MHNVIVILIGFSFALFSFNGFAQCAAAPVGTASDPVLQLKLNGDGKAGLGPANALTSNEEGAVVWDDTNDSMVICDGSNWVNIGSTGESGDIQSGFDSTETIAQPCTTVGTLSHSSSEDLLVCQSGSDINGTSCSTFNTGALSIGSDGSIYACLN
jgi:hypothetical protein